MKLFCKHKWVKLHEHTEPSAFEQMKRPSEIRGASKWVFDQNHVAVFACESCGKLKTVRG